MEASVFSTIVARNPKGAISLLRYNGYPVPKSNNELEGYMKDYFRKNDNENGHRSLAMIHPDKDLILETLVVKNFDGQETLNADAQTVNTKDENFKNCSGCAALASMAVDGVPSTDTKVVPISTINMVIIGSSLVLVAIILHSALK